MAACVSAMRAMPGCHNSMASTAYELIWTTMWIYVCKYKLHIYIYTTYVYNIHTHYIEIHIVCKYKNTACIHVYIHLKVFKYTHCLLKTISHSGPQQLVPVAAWWANRGATPFHMANLVPTWHGTCPVFVDMIHVFGLTAMGPVNG